MAQTTINTTELTQEQVSSFLVTPLEEQSQFLAAGPKIFDTPNALRIPKLPTTKAEQLQFVGELEPIPEVDADFDELHLLPSTMRSIKTISKYRVDSTGRRNTFSAEVVRDGDGGLEQEDQRCAGGASSTVAC